MMRPVLIAAIAALAGCNAADEKTAAPAAGEGPRVVAATAIDAGRYIVTIGGCNDCHTPDWTTNGGATPEAQWLTGVPLGWQGPWGTTYPSNLRLLAANVTEDAWVEMLHTRKDRPPMPWMNVNRMHEADARAIYQYLKALGSAGEAMPAPLPPGAEPKTPYLVMTPQGLPPGPPPAAPKM